MGGITWTKFQFDIYLWKTWMLHAHILLECYKKWIKQFLRYWKKHGMQDQVADVGAFLTRFTDYGHPMKPFFHRNPKLSGLGRQFGQIKFGAFRVVSVSLSAPILVLWVPCPCFPLINHYFYKKLSLYIQIPNIYLGLGFEFEFGPQRIRDLAFMCP